MASLESGEPSHAIRARVDAARALQQVRFAKLNKPSVLVNGNRGPAEVQKFCQLDKQGLATIRMTVERMGLSARLSSHPQVEPHHRGFGGE